MTDACTSTTHDEDPYIWLEEVESVESLAFAVASNEACLTALGDPAKDEKQTGTYTRVLTVLESDNRIPHVSHFGLQQTEEPILVNFWKDAQNPKGLWRQTTLASYKLEKPEWKTILDVDALAAKDGIGWVWGGSRPLPRARDPEHSAARATRALLNLSRGGSDATHIKEFDILTQEFVQEQPFVLPEAKTRAAYKSRDVLTVGSDFGPDTLTDSGYPRTVREWVRGTDIKDAPVVFEGEKTDVSVSMYVSDERIWGGGIYEVQSRSLTFYTSKYWIRGPLEFEHLLASDNPARATVADPPAFVAVDVQDDADIDFLGKLLLITLRSDWEPIEGETLYVKGSVLYVDADTFLQKGRAACEYKVLFAPTERTAFEYYTATKNYLILSTMENVKSKLEFFKIADGHLTKLPTEQEAQIRDVSCRPVDPYSGSDEFWFTTSDFTTPSTLYLADAAKMETAQDGPDAFITEKLKSLPDMYDASKLTVEQRTCLSKDGTEIPYFIIMDKNVVLDGNNPTLLYGYGGFEVSLGPHYVATPGLAWLERGGVYVEANIRGKRK
jgi:prolyl oligopeptidase